METRGFIGLVVVVSAFAAAASALPFENGRPAAASYSAPNRRPQRPVIITKHNFMEHLSSSREKKSGLVPIPKPFVVSTELAVKDEHSGRRGRTWKANDGSTVVEGE